MSNIHCPPICPFRTPTCHCDCQTYAKYREEVERARKEQARERLLAGYEVDNLRKRVAPKKKDRE